MNRENVQKVRDLIACVSEREPHRFNMSTFGSQIKVIDDRVVWDEEDDLSENEVVAQLKHDCNTCACIAGWAASLVEDETLDVENAAAWFMGLDSNEAGDLFYPRALHESWGGSGKWTHLRPEHALRVLDHLLETGKVNWGIIGEFEYRPRGEVVEHGL